MSCDHKLANEWARCSGKNASYITITFIDIVLMHVQTLRTSTKHLCDRKKKKKQIQTVKHCRPNGLASSRNLKTWVYLRLRLARPCVHLRWLAMTCAHFGRDQICTQVKASFSPFGHPTQVNASWVTSINLLLANEIEDSLLQNVF